MKKMALTIAALLVASSAMADDAYTIFAKSLTAKQYDKNLPSILVEQWLNYNLPSDVQSVWGENVTEYGEQTGRPEIDNVRDLPLCVEIELKRKGELIGYFLLFGGTEKKGKMKNAGLYYGYIKQGEKTIEVNELSEIKKMKGLW